MQHVNMVLTQVKNEIQDIDVKILVLQGQRETLTTQAWALEIAIGKDEEKENKKPGG